jgi:hypothetical protein
MLLSHSLHTSITSIHCSSAGLAQCARLRSGRWTGATNCGALLLVHTGELAGAVVTVACYGTAGERLGSVACRIDRRVYLVQIWSVDPVMKDVDFGALVNSRLHCIRSKSEVHARMAVERMLAWSKFSHGCGARVLAWLWSACQHGCGAHARFSADGSLTGLFATHGIRWILCRRLLDRGLRSQVVLDDSGAVRCIVSCSEACDC